VTDGIGATAESSSPTDDRRAVELSSSIRRKLAAAVGSAILVFVIGLAGALGVTLLLRSADRVENSHRVIGDLDRLLVHLTDAETGQRGYLITGDSTYLAPYLASLANLGDDTLALVADVAADSAQQTRAERLRAAIGMKLSELHRTVALRRDSGFAVSQQIVRTNAGKRTMDSIRAVVAEMALWEGKLREEQAQERTRRARFVLFAIGIGGLLALALVVFMSRQLRRDVIALSSAEGELQRRAQLLEEQALELAAQVEHAQAAAEEAEEASNEAVEARLEAERAMIIAEEASGAKSEFLATMSHELRTPLNAIIGYTSLLSAGVAGPLTEEQERQLSRVKSSSDHLLALIDEVLMLSRFDANRERIAREPFDVSSAIDDAVVIVEPLATQKGLQLLVSVPTERITLETDRGKLRQALVNLLSNAIKFTEHGQVSFGAHRDDDRIVFEVGDTGIGIEAEHLVRIFEPFWQVDRRMTRRVGGTGLGLAVTQRIASLLGGAVQVSSTLGKGSIFTLAIPRQAPADAA